MLTAAQSRVADMKCWSMCTLQAFTNPRYQGQSTHGRHRWQQGARNSAQPGQLQWREGTWVKTRWCAPHPTTQPDACSLVAPHERTHAASKSHNQPIASPTTCKFNSGGAPCHTVLPPENDAALGVRGRQGMQSVGRRRKGNRKGGANEAKQEVHITVLSGFCCAC